MEEIMYKKIVNVVKKDNVFQRFEVLARNRNKRQRYKEFIVEGVRNVNHAFEYGWKVKGVLYSGEREHSKWAKNIINHSEVAVNYRLSESLFMELSNKAEPSEILLLVEIRDISVIEMVNSENPVIAVFDRPSNRGNLGTIIRSCDAMGISGLVISGHGVDLYDPETIASTTGSFFSLPVQRLDSQEEIEHFFERFKNKYKDAQTVGTSAHAEYKVNEIDFLKPTLLLIGNETTGLNNYYKEKADRMTKIPIGGSASSLNVACASSMIMYEIQRQREFSL